MNSEYNEEKTEQPTPHKIKKSKKFGILSYSRDVNSFFIFLFFFFFLKISWKKNIYFLYQCFLHSFIFNSYSLENERLSLIFSNNYIKFFIFYLLVLFIGILFILIIAPMLFYNHFISFNQYNINFTLVDIINSIKKIFSLNFFWEFFKILLKITFFIFSAGLYLYKYYPNFFFLTRTSLLSNISLELHVFNMCCIFMLSIVFGISIIDFFLQHYRNNQNLLMTLQEIKDEFKELEGNPAIKQRIYRTIRKKRRTINDILNADVIIMDKLKYAVAIQYDVEIMSIPKILLKVSSQLVKKIRILSKKHDIPILLLPELTKALVYNSSVGQDIPDFLYKPVAEVFAWIWELRRWKKYGGIYPQPPKHISIPTKVYFTGK